MIAIIRVHKAVCDVRHFAAESGSPTDEHVPCAKSYLYMHLGFVLFSYFVF